MDYLPLFFNLKGKSCLLVGGGSIALRKARLLTSAGALIRVVAPEIKTELQELVKATGGELIFAPYQAHYLEQAVLVISATDLDELNRQVAEDCHQRKLPVNVVDNPRLCSVIMPAIVDRSPLIIGITSGGEAPVLARIVRTKLEAMFPASWGRVGQFASRFRQAVKDRFSDIEERRRFWEASLDGPIFEQALAGNEDAAAQMLQQKLASADAHEPGGEVYLVGAGPGDPDLLTFKALRLMQKAEVVLYDRLVSQPILDMTRRDAERVYVGKKRADHAVPQTEINQLLLHYAQRGKRVLRLKGGDPFIFGRGGEEIELLAQHNVPFQVVPGITAASGCACYAGIPLTHRDYAQSVRFITGHLKEGGSQLNWSELIAKEQTLVFYMSLVGISEICQQLIAHGKDAQTPAALVEKGTTPDQQVHISNLAALPDYVSSTEIHAPTLLIIGGVVSLADKLAWFKQAAPSR